MERQIDIINLTQQNFIKLVDSVTEEQFNKIPVGFGNNIIWNFAHILSAFQMLCYGRSGLPIRLDEGFVNSYKIGTKPESTVSAEQYVVFKEYAHVAVEKFKEDYAAGVFEHFKPFATSTGFVIDKVETALQYVVMHHGLHIGYAMALKKLVV